jgi:hypothetical protein
MNGLRGLLAAAGLFSSLVALPAGAQAPRGVDPLAARVDSTDARRFAELFAATGGKPDAAALQSGYLAGAGRGVEIFTPGRIENARNLAAAVAAEPERYAHAIRTCLPLVDGLAAEMRAVYLAFRGLLPDRPLPQVHVVFGAGNSGGTAAPDAQVLGLEVMCGPGTTPEAFRDSMRTLFAHETVHSWQEAPSKRSLSDPLLLYALREGVPDLLASLVTGQVPTPSRDAWGRAREAALWAEFEADRAVVRAGTGADGSTTKAADAAVRRWFGNYGAAPPGWPYEAGYWVGMRIAQGYLDRATDKRAAIETLLKAEDPAAILAASGYRPAAPDRAKAEP